MVGQIKKYLYSFIMFSIDRSTNIKELLLGLAAIIAVFQIPQYKLSNAKRSYK